MKYICSLFIIWILTIGYVQAQLSFSGKPQSILNTEEIYNSIPFISMPTAEVKNEIQQSKRLLKSNRFAHPFFVNLNLENSGKWFIGENNTKIWRLGIRSKGAYSINLIFDKFILPASGKLFLYTPNQTTIEGAFTNQSHNGIGAFATVPIAGDEIIIEYSQQADESETPQIKIGAVNHDYKNIFSKSFLKAGNFGDSDNCHTDMSCLQGNYNEEKAVTRIIVDGTELCSGTLINNTKNDGTPYIISAAHCLNTGATNHSFVILFNYQSPNCQTQIEGYKSQTLSGATIMTRIDAVDCLLLKANQTPPAIYQPYWAGWDLTTNTTPPFHSIHHPQGDVKKFARTIQPIFPASFTNTDPPFDADSHWLVQEWHLGTTEAGSSGSGLFSSSGLLKGCLSGGSALCSNPVDDYYYRINKAWTYNTSNDSENLRRWLDTNNESPNQLSGFDLYEKNKIIRITNITNKDSAVFEQTIDGSTVRYMGNNTQNIEAVAETFYQIKTCTLEGIYLHLAKKSSTGSLNLKIFSGSYFSETTPPLLDTLISFSSLKASSENLIVLKRKLEVKYPLSIGVVIPSTTFALYYQLDKATRTSNTAYLKKDGNWQPFNLIHPNGEKSSGYIDLLATSITYNDSTIIEEDHSELVSVYPNPAKTDVNFKWGINPLKRLVISNVNGQHLNSYNYGFPYGNESIGISNLPNGIYIFTFTFDNQTISEKIIIQK